MTERLLQYIWQYQYINTHTVLTDEGEKIQIIHPGIINYNQGPDFSDAKIRIGQTTWAGSIELHVKASDWIKHQHGNDKNYKNVILHVVWHKDASLNLPFPTLILQDKVPKLLLARYEDLMKAGSFIPCEKSIHRVDDLAWLFWKERLLVERLQAKTHFILDYLSKNNSHWEEALWWLLARNFGIHPNAAAFEKIAQSVPLHMLAKPKDQILRTEALLFGQAGLLDVHFKEDYPKLLQKEYRFLKHKYKLQMPRGPLIFLRMRPSNFPTVRLAQLAMLIHQHKKLFSKIIECKDLATVKELLQVTASDYWHYHYVFDVVSPFKKKTLGAQMIDNILINTVVPMIFAYGHFYQEPRFKDKALAWLEQVRAEKNTITKGFGVLQIKQKSAFDSQALIQLKNEYCNKKRCLDCAVGNKLLRNNKDLNKLSSSTHSEI